MSKSRVVVTGMGAITPLGLSVDQFWTNLIAGRPGISSITHFDASTFPVKVAAEVKGFDPREYMDLKMVDRSSRFGQFAIAAARMAVESARLDMSREKPEQVGVVVATCLDMCSIESENEVLKSRGPRRINPLFVTRTGPQMSSVQVGLMLGAKGPNSGINSACASGNDALGTALNHLRLGHAEVMVAGASDAGIHPLALAGMSIVGALSRESDPARACRPFDLNRNGFVFGEAAAVMVLETYEHARNRGAPILAEVAGVGWSFDAHSESAPSPEAEAIAMKRALQDAEISPEDITYVNAHGTGTRLNDVSETRALKLVFDDHAYRIPVSSNKSMVGHSASAAAAVEAVASIMTVMTGMIPPTINYETPDPECDLDYVPNVARRVQVDACLSSAFGLGGQNCCMILKKFKEG